MSDGQLGFIPWMQKGLINQTALVEGVATTVNERASLEVKVRPHLSPSDIIKNIQLIGPGDILGFDPAMVVRSAPDDGSFNFDYNLMPHIEFAEVDFPWRYTPARANSNNQLRPWLALIVLTDDEIFSISPGASDDLPHKLIIKPGTDPVTSAAYTYGRYFHPQGEHWAWAHVQVNDPDASLQDLLPTDPSAGLSRLLCPRRLSATTQYTAFIVPAFETGRLGGLGQATGTTNVLAPSWNVGVDIALPTTATAANQFPVYYSWRFGTASSGDFETLARAIEPKVIAPELGAVKMDISNTGMGLSHIPTVPDTVDMVGALQPASYVPAPPQSLSTISGSGIGLYTGKLRDVLNIAANVASTSYTGVTPPDNPYIPGATFASDDPVILPPIYGQWPANVNKVEGSIPQWVQEINLDSRYRAAAGLGSKVVRDNKEKFMEEAWDQIGDVLAVNNKIAKATLAEKVSKQIYTKHFIADTKRTSTATANMPQNMSHTLNLGARLLKKVRNGIDTSISSTTTSIVSGVPGSTLYTPVDYNNFSVKNVLSRSYLTSAGTSSTFRKVARNRSQAVSRLSLASQNKELVYKVSDFTVKPAPRDIVSPDASQMILKDYLTDVMKPANNTSLVTYFTDGGASASLAAASAAVVNSSYQDIYTDFKNTLTSYDGVAAGVKSAADISINAGQVIKKVQTSVDPSITIPSRVIQQIRVDYAGSGITPSFNNVMAYPVLNEPMYTYLLGLSSEYLLPNLTQYPTNTVAVLDNNRKFIEAFMAGANHELARELLWQGYPTDQRGSYFRRFWDINDTAFTGSSQNYLYDIDMMHRWTGALGTNYGTTRLGFSPDLTVLMIRADLLKKYPNTLIYARRAVWNSSGVGHAFDPHPIFDGGDPDTEYIRFPMFKAHVQPDIVLLGFDFSVDEAKGSTTPSTDAGGWFFVFSERPGQTNFGMDNPPFLPPTAQYDSWDDINWEQMAQAGTAFSTARMNLLSSNKISIFNGLSGAYPLRWDGNTNSAQVASILFQDPSMAAIHAESML